MSQPVAEKAVNAAESVDPVRRETVRPSGCRRFVMIFGFSCLPGLLIGVVAGMVLSNSSNPVDELGHKILYRLLQSDL